MNFVFVVSLSHVNHTESRCGVTLSYSSHKIIHFHKMFTKFQQIFNRNLSSLTQQFKNILVALKKIHCYTAWKHIWNSEIVYIF